jgi:NAD(P)H-hydrate epimerase
MTFVTDLGRVVPAVDEAQMREVDRVAVQETGPNLFQMMENAGRNLAELAIELLPVPLPTASVLVLAGSGGNGGGGICAARHLANHGLRVALCLADPAHLGEVPGFQRKVFRESGGEEISVEHVDELRADLVLDALLGYSLRGAPEGSFATLIRYANKQPAPVLALDLPSGLDATSGAAPGEVVKPRWTMTLALPKTGLSSERAGTLWLADIGIPAAVYRRLGLAYETPFDSRYRVPLKRL